MLTRVWRRETEQKADCHRNCNDGKSIISVSVSDKGSVFIEGWIVGPRGGYTTGFPNFSRDEWNEVKAAVEAHFTELVGAAASKGEAL